MSNSKLSIGKASDISCETLSFEIQYEDKTLLEFYIDEKTDKKIVGVHKIKSFDIDYDEFMKAVNECEKLLDDEFTEYMEQKKK